ncbi:hypothetical protein [Streptomyces canus]|uniref:hypothetical protein n=1 Tax=Streptomyces canus TaxID=58343 RepID=UPI000B1C7D3A|nr:hypothetical protein [Streptomyces canus]
MNRTVPVLPPNEVVTVAAFWFSWLTAVHRSALVNGVLSQTVAGVVRQTLRTTGMVC